MAFALRLIVIMYYFMPIHLEIKHSVWLLI